MSPVQPLVRLARCLVCALFLCALGPESAAAADTLEAAFQREMREALAQQILTLGPARIDPLPRPAAAKAIPAAPDREPLEAGAEESSADAATRMICLDVGGRALQCTVRPVGR